MAFPPELAQQLRTHDNESVRKGGAILEEQEAFADGPRKIRDSGWAFLFAVTCVFVLYMAMDSKAKTLFASQGQYMDPLLQAFLASVVAALIMQRLVKHFTKAFVYVVLLYAPGLIVLFGLGMIYASQLFLVKLFGASLVLVGGICISCLVFCYRDLIPFSVLLIRTVMDVADCHFSMLAISFAGCCFSLIWFFVCACAQASVYLIGNSKINHFRSDTVAAQKMIIFLDFLVLFWGAGVIMGVCHVAYCGVFGRWYFGKDRSPGAFPVMTSAKVACTSSFGSVCFGTFVVAFFQAASAMARMAREAAEEDGNLVLCLIFCIIQSILDCIGDIIGWVCSYAYVQCAVRGLGLMDSVKATFSLCESQHVGLIIASSLDGSVVAFGALVCGCVGGGTAWLLGGKGWFAMAGLLMGSQVGAAFLLPIRSGAATLAICFAENPEALAALRPELHRDFGEKLFCPSSAEEGGQSSVEMQAGHGTVPVATPVHG